MPHHPFGHTTLSATPHKITPFLPRHRYPDASHASSMPSKRPRVEYTEETLAKALYDVNSEGLSIRMAAQKWGVPRVTISDRMHGIGAVGDQRQPKSVLTSAQEARLSEWILKMESLGYSPSQSQIRACVLTILVQNGYHQPRVGVN